MLRITISSDPGPLKFEVKLGEKVVIESSPMHFMLDGVDLADQVRVKKLDSYAFAETYPWRGVHSIATNHCNGSIFEVQHPASKATYTLDVRAFDDAVAFRFSVSGGTNARVPDEATAFVLPAESTVWYHDLNGHYEGVHVKKQIAEIAEGQWAAPPVTFKLPEGAGYASITEANLKNYSGMALQADGHRGLRVGLGHSQPPSHPYLLRYGTNEAQRLSIPASITGPITTPWRVVMVGHDLNALVNCDAVQSLCPPPDLALFPNGLKTDWIRPGRAVWKYLDDGGSNTLATMKDFTRMAAELGFEHNILEGFWSRWSDDEIKELVSYAKIRHVSIWFWKHSKSLRDPQERHAFLQKCHDLGIAGAKIDFFDHEAKEVIDLYQSLLKEAAELHLLLDFHGANKPTGLSRMWPNELTREAVKGMEASKMEGRATHDVTLPFTRFLAGPAEYTPMIFSARRANTTWAHQIASPAIFSTPLLSYAANPSNILANPCCEMIKSIPATWDETIVLPPSEIGEVAVFARRVGGSWFLAVMNGPAQQKFKVPLSFLGSGDYDTLLVRDDAQGIASQKKLDSPLTRRHSLTIDLHAGGGFLARFRPK